MAIQFEELNICGTCQSFNQYIGDIWICENKYKAGITIIGSLVDATDTCDKHEPRRIPGLLLGKEDKNIAVVAAGREYNNNRASRSLVSLLAMAALSGGAISDLLPPVTMPRRESNICPKCGTEGVQSRSQHRRGPWLCLECKNRW